MRTNGPVFSLNFDAPVTSLELSAPTSTLVLTYANDVSFHPVVPNSSPSHTLTLPHAPSSASLHPTMGDRFIAGSVGDPWVRVYGLEDGEERELYKGHHGPVHCVMYSPDGEMYASGSGEFLSPGRILTSTFTSDTLSLCFIKRMGLSVCGRQTLENRTACGKASPMAARSNLFAQMWIAPTGGCTGCPRLFHALLFHHHDHVSTPRLSSF